MVWGWGREAGGGWGSCPKTLSNPRAGRQAGRCVGQAVHVREGCGGGRGRYGMGVGAVWGPCR